jgi:hypothetical protein
MNLRYTSRAKNDIDLAFEWYELQRRGLGFEFLDCVEASINNMIYFPVQYYFSRSQMEFGNDFHVAPQSRLLRVFE